MDFWGEVWKRVWEMAFFWSEIGPSFGDAGGTPPTKIPRSTPPPPALRESDSAGQFPQLYFQQYKVLLQLKTRWKRRGLFTAVSVKIFLKAMMLLISTTCLSCRSFLPFAELRKSFFHSLMYCTFSQALFFQVKRSLFENLELNYALPDDDDGL